MTTDGYFLPEESIEYRNDDIMNTLLTIGRRYMGANPPHPPIYRVSRSSAIRKMDDHRYHFPLSDLFPDMKEDQIIYAWGKVWSDRAESFEFQITCNGPIRLYHNGTKIYGSSIDEENLPSPALRIRTMLVHGWNHVVLEFHKGKQGCGGIFGTSSRKNKPHHYIIPSLEREGGEGWLYTAPLNHSLPIIPEQTLAEWMTGVTWLPDNCRLGKVVTSAQLERLYKGECDDYVYAWTLIDESGRPPAERVLTGNAFGPAEWMLDGNLIHIQHQAGSFHLQLPLNGGQHQLTVKVRRSKEGWGYQLNEKHELRFRCPQDVKGYTGNWLYLGPFAADQSIHLPDYQNMTTTAYSAVLDKPVYWQIDQPNAYVRPFLENEWFGRWNYPLGVTLYGLLELGKITQHYEMIQYVIDHVEFATSRFDYSVWDRQQYGAAGLNNQLSHIDSLDDCGSFGALMLLAHREKNLEGVPDIADHIADYILRQQDRLESGALYRKIGVSRKMDNTMWCDDLYMSIPFLCRYAEWTRQSEILEAAAEQILLYKQYLYMPEQQIMSHVYHVEKNQPTLTAWGRGNGWVLFSLTELLTVLSPQHHQYEELVLYYQELSAGYLRLIGKNGLWHQVLTDPESYEETSCTAMFIYGFARGIQLGWHPDPEPYIEAVHRGWQGICRRSVDRYGNIYGVCKGSSYSFSHHYYKHELGWNLNDTHGIGIVLLAGLEALRMQTSLQKAYKVKNGNKV